MPEADTTIDTAADAFAQLGPIDETPLDQDDPKEEDQDEQNSLDLSEADDDNDGEAGEDQPGDEDEQDPEPPAIDAPTHWTAEAKAKFAALDAEGQQLFAAEAKKQERFAATKAEEAAAQRKQAESILDQHVNLHRQFAERLTAYAQAFDPQEPDISLLAADPHQYAYQMQGYRNAVGQRNAIAQQAAQAQQEAEAIEGAREAKASQEAYNAIVQEFPEWDNAEGRKAIVDRLTPIGVFLGYGDRLKGADVVDLKALETIRGLKVDAEKYRAALGKQMQNVRDAKLKPKVSVPGAAQPKGTLRAQNVSDSMSKLRKSGDVHDAAAVFRRMG